MKSYVVIVSFLLIGVNLADIPEIPDLDDIEAIKERCDKKGGPGVYDKVKAARDETVTCIKGLINFDTVKDEVEEAKKTGSMDEVFGKYCNKRPDLKACVKKTYDAAEPCLEETEKDAINTTAYILNQIGDFVCHNDGDRIAMFVAEGGVECIKARTEQIRNCFNQTLKFNPTNFSPNSIPNLTLDKKKCDNMKTIQECVVKDLEDHCEDSTPANFVDAMFRFIKKLACKDIKKRSVSLRRHIRNAIETTREQLKTEIETKLTKICNKHGDKKSYEKLIGTLNDARSCMNNYKIFITPLSVHRAGLDNCTKPARKAFESCLSESEKYYPTLMFQMLQNLIEFMYKNADKWSASPANMEFAQCMKTIGQNESQSEILDCYNKYKDDADIIPPKAELCGKLSEFNSCLNGIFKRKCIQDIKTEKFLNELFAALETPCKKEEEIETTTEAG